MKKTFFLLIFITQYSLAQIGQLDWTFGEFGYMSDIYNLPHSLLVSPNQHRIHCLYYYNDYLNGGIFSCKPHGDSLTTNFMNYYGYAAFNSFNNFNSKKIINTLNESFYVTGSTGDFLSKSSLSITKLNSQLIVDTSFHCLYSNISSNSSDQYNCLSEVSNDKILAFGTTHDTSNGKIDLVLSRYLNNGQFDSTFGTNGIKILDFGAYESSDFMELDSLERILLVSNMNGTAKLIRIFSDGNIDSTFGTNGSITLLPDVKSFKCVSNTNYFIQAGSKTLMYKSNGNLDSTFGINGIIQENTIYHPQSVLQADGKVIIVGLNASSSRILSIKRYLKNGQLDNTFGTNGNTQVDIINNKYHGWQSQPNPNDSISLNGIYMQPDSQLLIYGACLWDGLSFYDPPNKGFIAKLNTFPCTDAIAVQPTNQQAYVGDTVYFISTSSNPDAVYQWQVNSSGFWEDLGYPGWYTDDTLRVLSPKSWDNYKFRCIVGSKSCKLISNEAILKIKCPQISDPISQTIYLGQSTKISATANKSNASYTWQVLSAPYWQNLGESSVYQGVHSDTLRIIDPPISANGYAFRCFVSLGCVDTSLSATLSITCPDSILQQPISQTINLGQSTKISATANKSNASYTWQVLSASYWQNLGESSVYQGVHSDTLRITNPPFSANGYAFRCIVSVSCPDTSLSAILNITCTDSILQQPISQSIVSGESAFFEVTSMNQLSKFQWQVYKLGNWENLIEDEYYVGTNSKKMQIRNVPITFDSNNYRCITKGICLDTSSKAMLNVKSISQIGDMMYVYPNPNQGVFYIEIPKELLDEDFVLSNIHGQTITQGRLTKLRNEINIPGVNSGEYFLKIGLEFNRKILVSKHK